MTELTHWYSICIIQTFWIWMCLKIWVSSGLSNNIHQTWSKVLGVEIFHLRLHTTLLHYQLETLLFPDKSFLKRQTSRLLFLCISQVYWHSLRDPVRVHKSSTPGGSTCQERNSVSRRFVSPPKITVISSAAFMTSFTHITSCLRLSSAWSWKN